MSFCLCLTFFEVFSFCCSPTETSLLTEPAIYVCPRRYVVLNCSAENTAWLGWTVVSNSGKTANTQINCSTQDICSAQNRSGQCTNIILCLGSTDTRYAIITNASDPCSRRQNMTSFLTITDINDHLRIDCIGAGEIQKRYLVHPTGMFVANLCGPFCFT